MPVGSAASPDWFVNLHRSLVPASRLCPGRLSVSGQRLVISPGNAEITHVRRQQWLVSQVITHLAPHRPSWPPSCCSLFMAIPEATDLSCRIGGRLGREVGEVTEKRDTEPRRPEGFGEAGTSRVNNDSFGNERLGVCHLHVRDLFVTVACPAARGAPRGSCRGAWRCILRRAHSHST